MKQVRSTTTSAEAHLIRGYLEEHGIEAVVQGELLSDGRAELGPGTYSSATVWVVADQELETASRLLADVDLRRDTNPSHCGKCGYDLAGLPEPRCPECGQKFYRPTLWVCPTCGEEIEGHFSNCWQCSARDEES